MNDDDIKAIRARLEAATPGPWFASEYLDDGQIGVISNGGGAHKGTIVVGVSSRLTVVDATLIANAPTDIAALLAEVERLRDPLGSQTPLAWQLAEDMNALAAKNAALEAEVELCPAAAHSGGRHDPDRPAEGRGVPPVQADCAHDVRPAW